MEDFVSCSICAEDFDSLHFIPKMLKCGHTFCSPCLIKLLQENPFCPNCRIQLTEIESSLPTNYTALNAVDFYQSKCSAEKVVDTAAEVAKRKDIILKKKTQMTWNVKILDKCLAKLEELTMSQSERIDTVNMRKILDEIDEDLKKTDVVRSDDIKSSISILLSSFQVSEQFLFEIIKKLQNGEKIFAVHKINEEFKYGEVSFFSNQLFFYSLNSSQVSKDSSLIWFEDVKQCLNSKDFCTFIKICYKEKKLTSFVIMEMFNQVLCNEFIDLCTGECGPSYKGSMFEMGHNNRNNSYTELPTFLTVHEVTDIENETMRLMDYINCYEKNNSDSFDENEMLLYLHFHHGGFSIVRHASTKVKNPNFLFGCSITPFSITPDITCRPPIGRVISPFPLYKDINYENPSNLILDCGILINI